MGKTRGSADSANSIKQEEENTIEFEEAFHSVRRKILKRDRRERNGAGCKKRSSAALGGSESRPSYFQDVDDEEEEDRKTPNCFLLFGNRLRQSIKQELPLLSNNEVSRHLGQMWRMLSEEQQRPFKIHAAYLRRKQILEKKKNAEEGIKRESKGVESAVPSPPSWPASPGSSSGIASPIEVPSIFCEYEALIAGALREGAEGGGGKRGREEDEEGSGSWNEYGCGLVGEGLLPFELKRKRFRLDQEPFDQITAEEILCPPMEGYSDELRMVFSPSFYGGESPPASPSCFSSMPTSPLPSPLLSPSLSSSLSPSPPPSAPSSPEPLADLPPLFRDFASAIDFPLDQHPHPLAGSLLGLPADTVVYLLPMMTLDGTPHTTSSQEVPVQSADPSAPLFDWWIQNCID